MWGGEAVMVESEQLNRPCIFKNQGLRRLSNGRGHNAGPISR